MAEKREKEKRTAAKTRGKRGIEKPDKSVDLSRPGKIQARVIDAENGLKELAGVCAVRIQSRDYNLLVMDDYLPVLGRIDGSVAFLTAEGELSLDGIRGFYKHQHNEFTLLVEEHAKAEEG